jgi:uncharacterized protein (TIGR02145 family)
MKKTIYFLLFTGLIAIISCQQSDELIDEQGTVADVDGNIYHTVTIGNQVWMVENLKTTHFQNGDTIPNLKLQREWANQIIDSIGSAYCNYDNNPENGERYGRLYNWWVINDPRKIAPQGWHIPTPEEWDELNTYVKANIGSSGAFDKALAANSDWEVSDKYGTLETQTGYNLTTNNSSGFSAMPAGFRSEEYHPEYNWPSGLEPYFAGIHHSAKWWGINLTTNKNYAVFCNLNWFGLRVFCDTTGGSKKLGLSIRCIKD